MAEKTRYSRRDFLKIVGATSGLAAAGCKSDVPEKLIPYVIQPDEVVPGIATWYSGACSECSAGCGILVRVREGRAVKLEGNPAHPVNKGGLCAIGQSALQSLYDPDRIREPLKRDINGSFKTQSWTDAVKAAGTAISSAPAGKKVVFLTGRLTGSVRSLIASLAGQIKNFEHVEYEPLDRSVQDLASEQSFGKGTRVQYDFSQARCIVGVGADYLETWMSPVEYARGWAAGRKPNERGEMSYVVHIEPRLSLTAANADRWLRSAPGASKDALLALLSFVIEEKGSQAPSSARAEAERALSGINIDSSINRSGLSRDALKDVARRLAKADSSLVVVGGASVSGSDARDSVVLGNLLNAVLGNIGKTVRIVDATETSPTQTSAGFGQFLKDLQAKSVHTLILAGTNPAYSLPSGSGFEEGVASVANVIAMSTQIDETTRLATLVLPVSTSLEAWNDAEPQPGVWNLNQPAMQPLYKTQCLGDNLLAIARELKVSPEEKTFYDYIRSSWKNRFGANDFEARWLKWVESGGTWEPVKGRAASLVSGAGKILSQTAAATKGLSLLAYPSVNFFDGSPANRAWLQEIPDPMTTAVWGSWVEVHPDTAAKHGLNDSDIVRVKTSVGGVSAPVHINKNIHPDVVAVPLGQGHRSIGRYGNGVGVNVVSVLSIGQDSPDLSYLSSGIELSKDISEDELVRLQFSEEQGKRGILRSVGLSKLKSEHVDDAAVDGLKNGHEKHKEEHDPLALGPQEAPRQMYKQMEHPQYRWGMSIDLASCTGCSACVVACYAENNVPVVGKEICAQGREMAWIRIEHYNEENDPEHPIKGFLPMLCQHCGNAPCEPVCPVYATYHNEEGLNSMTYNRCVGTRYCLNNCSYKVRRFNWFLYSWPEPLTWQLNPDVTVREVGIMEKCSFCVQRIRDVERRSKDEGRPVRDGEIQPACASSCPTQAIRFGNLLDGESMVSRDAESARGYKVLDAYINTQPAITYLARVENDSEV